MRGGRNEVSLLCAKHVDYRVSVYIYIQCDAIRHENHHFLARRFVEKCLRLHRRMGPSKQVENFKQMMARQYWVYDSVMANSRRASTGNPRASMRVQMALCRDACVGSTAGF